MEVLTNLVIIILQYIHVSNHHIAHLKLTCYLKEELESRRLIEVLDDRIAY